MEYPYSDTVAGYARSFDADRSVAVLRTAAGSDVAITLTPNTYAKYVYNLGEEYQDADAAECKP